MEVQVLNMKEEDKKAWNVNSKDSKANLRTDAT